MADNVFLSQHTTPQLGLNINDVIEIIKDQEDKTLIEQLGQEMSLFGVGVQSEANYSVLSSVTQSEPGTDPKKNAYVQITEQPQPKALRFRYICEGRSAGSIPGVSSTSENKTYPAIKVCNYKGHAFVVVSCVTAEPPYRPHPHNLVGKSCKNGICTMKITNDSMECMFSNLGIQCVKKKEVDRALEIREEQRVDPFRTGFAHRNQSQSINLNVVRLCFQVFLEGKEKGKFTYPLTPVVTEPIFDRKSTSDLVICKLSDCTSTVCGGKEIILLCEKVTKEDIQIRFFEIKDDMINWEAFGDFQAADVHKQVAISFKTPKYKDIEIQSSVKVSIQLLRPSDGSVSEPRPFEYLPMDSDPQYVRRKFAKYNDRRIGMFFQDCPNITGTPSHISDLPSGSIPRPVIVAARSSKLPDRIKVEPQEVTLSPNPDLAGAIGTKTPISPQHNGGGIMYQMPVSNSLSPPSSSATPNSLPATYLSPYSQPFFQIATTGSVPLAKGVPLLFPVPDPGGILFEDSVAANVGTSRIVDPTDNRYDIETQKPTTDANMDDLGEIRSSELFHAGSAAESMLENFNNSLTFSDSVPQASNQLGGADNSSQEHRINAIFTPNIPPAVTTTYNIFQKVDETPVVSSDSLKNLKNELDMLKNLTESRDK